MVKGVSKHVIVIKSPDPHLFEEAIFIVKEDVLHKGITQETVLREAQDVANRYVKVNKKKGLFRTFPSLAYTLTGAGAASILWLAANYLF